MAVGTVCTIDSIRTICAILTILSMIDGHLTTLSELNDVTDLCHSIINRSDALYIVVILESIDNDLKNFDIGVHLIALLLQGLESRPSWNLDFSAVGKNECHIIRAACIVYIEEHGVTVCAGFTLRALLTLWPLLTYCRSHLNPSCAIVV